jgi:TetR/AcrR family transcriptional regulator, lmrAB and yxaGH operons repressor
MSPRLVTEDLLLERLTDVFRSDGFDGASLRDLAAATGLQKSSLYHRFPGGKAQMATEVIERLGNDTVTAALASLDADEPVRERVELVGRALTAFYEAGAKSCLLDTMSVGGAGNDVLAALAAAANGWIAAFERVAASTGVKRADARARAQDAIAAIEGALVLSRVTNDRRPFARAIERLPDVLLGAETDANTTGKEK